MPKKKTPDENPKDQFKRFLEVAREKGVDEHKAAKGFKSLTRDRTSGTAIADILKRGCRIIVAVHRDDDMLESVKSGPRYNAPKEPLDPAVTPDAPVIGGANTEVWQPALRYKSLKEGFVRRSFTHQ